MFSHTEDSRKRWHCVRHELSKCLVVAKTSDRDQANRFEATSKIGVRLGRVVSSSTVLGHASPSNLTALGLSNQPNLTVHNAYSRSTSKSRVVFPFTDRVTSAEHYRAAPPFVSSSAAPPFARPAPFGASAQTTETRTNRCFAGISP